MDRNHPLLVVGGAAVLALGLVTPVAFGADAPVADAAMKGEAEAVRSLITAGADVNVPQGDGMTALHWAAFQDDADLAQVLIDASANVEAETRIGAIRPLSMRLPTGVPP